MKATIELPDELYLQVKAKTAMQGRAIREVTAELYQRWLDVGGPSASAAPALKANVWLDEFIAIGREAMNTAPPGPTAREILAAGRNRLDPHAG
jgi:predicted transcriptional regulator YdeE